MKYKKSLLVGVLSLVAVGASVVYADSLGSRKPVEFYSGHTHDSDGTHGAPSHSGGTDSRGCHNGSVPYHCH